MSKEDRAQQSSDKRINKWLKAGAVCLGIIALAVVLYFVLLQPAMDRHNELIDQRIEELKRGK